jgi:hypothetical protein
MKKSLLVILVAMFLAGCGASGGDLALNTGAQSDSVKKPKIPANTNVEASVLDAKEDGSDTERMQKLLDEIEKELDRPNISQEDIRRGWYYASEEDKKFGTPSSWIWLDDAKNSRWISPNAIEEKDYFELSDLCVQTAGSYVISCLDAEIASCEYIAKSECRCVEGSKWNEEQGCILTDEKGEYVSISQDELRKGWYTGLPNEKKLGTPLNWIWIDAGQESKWQNPSPQ